MPGPIIVLMTVVVPQYHQEFLEGLHRAGLEVYHFTLLASRATLQRRLRERGKGRSSYAARQIERCLKALVQPVFAEHLVTDRRGIDEVADDLAARAGLVLQPRSGGLFRTVLRRWRVQWAHRRHD